jgi:hypothetical protein
MSTKAEGAHFENLLPTQQEKCASIVLTDLQLLHIQMSHSSTESHVCLYDISDWE